MKLILTGGWLELEPFNGGYKITDGYFIAEQVEGKLEQISDHLQKVANQEEINLIRHGRKEHLVDNEQIKTFEDLQNIGKRKGKPEEFIK